MSDAPAAAPAKSKRGGKRPGAGRKKKNHQSPTAIGGLDLEAALKAPVPDDIEGAAQAKARSAMAELVKLIMYGSSDSVRVKACCDILDRGYGKPSTDAGGLQQMALFTVNTPAALGKEIRDEARKYANVALEVLDKIRSSGESESARRQAARALLDRGLGTVAAAKLDDIGGARPLGKKEEAQRVAQEAGTAGPYATPAGPRTLQ